jgi:hypothetical protein
LERLRELKFKDMDSSLLEQIDCPKIQKISVDGEMRFRNSKSWKNFVKKHKNIEHIELKDRNVLRKQYSGPHFLSYFQNFPTLKTLKLFDEFDNERHVEFIGDVFTKLEHSEVLVDELFANYAVNCFREKFPHHGCDSRKFRKRKDGAWDWLIMLKKF